MAQNISNRFYVTALEDGTTLHGNLVSDKSLTQTWNKTNASPDWRITENQPTIYITLMSGNTPAVPSNEFTWLYNGAVINFNGSTSTDGKFQKTTYPLEYNNVTYNMPALKIIDNLASNDNVDVDTITFLGKYTIGGQSIDFSAMTQIRIATVQPGSEMGVVNFVGGISDITEYDQKITMFGKWYGADGKASTTNDWSTQWYLNDAVSGTAGSNITVGSTTYSQAFQVDQKDVVDHAVVRCDFIKGGNVKYSAYVYIDDMQDPEFMYIQYNGANGNAASLRKGDTAEFLIWVGSRDNPAVRMKPNTSPATPEYNHMKVKLLDCDGEVIIGGSLATGIPASDSNGWRSLDQQITQEGKFPITPHYDTVVTYGKNITGIVMAYTD